MKVHSQYFFAGDFNGYYQLWWNDDDTNAEIEEITDEPNIVIESCTRNNP